MSRVVVIGGGIAGVSAAAALARRGREVLVFEKERLLGTYSTGHNAGIYRLAVTERVNVELALLSRQIGDRVVAGGSVRTTGALYPCADESQRAQILEAAAFAGVREASRAEAPALLAHGDRPALWSPHDGVIDVAGLVDGLSREARSAGAQFVLDARIDALDVEAGRVRGVVAHGETIAADTVIDATGAWSPQLPGACDVGVRPHRRHLFVLDSPFAKAIPHVVWDLTDGVYLRPESGGLLVSPCDEESMSATEAVPRAAEAQALLFDKLSRWAPALAHASVRRWWAGLRPLTSDHKFVVGPDPLQNGLFRLGGFGGHGMTAGPAAGEIAAALVCGESHPLAAELDPARILRNAVR